MFSRCKSWLWYVVSSLSIIISCTILISSLRWNDTQRTSITRVYITRTRHLRYGRIFFYKTIWRSNLMNKNIVIHECNGIWSVLTLIALHVHATMADACRFTRPDRRWLRRLREWNYDTLVFSRIAYIRGYSERTITISFRGDGPHRTRGISRSWYVEESRPLNAPLKFWDPCAVVRACDVWIPMTMHRRYDLWPLWGESIERCRMNVKKNLKKKR